MRKTRLLLASLILSLCVLTAWSVFDRTRTASSGLYTTNPDDSGNYEIDILPAILKLNSDPVFSPPKQFKKGHVTTAKLNSYLEKTDYGFIIKLPSQTNTPTPAVVDGHLFLSGGFGSKQYYSFEATSGELNWAINLDDDGPSSPAIQDGVVVFNTESCTIFACDLLSGKMIWSYWLGDPLMSMPTISNGIVYTSYPAHWSGAFKNGKNKTDSIDIYPTHALAAFELKTGKILWQKWIDSDIMSAPVAKEDLLYVTTFSGALYKIKPVSGDIIEAKAMRATSAPIFDRDNQMIISRRGDNANDSFVSEVVVRGYMSKRMYRKRADYLDGRVQGTTVLKQESMNADAGNGFGGGAPASSNWQAANKNVGQSNVASLQAFQGSRGAYYNGNLYNTMGDEVICTDTAGVVKWKYSLDGDLKKQGGFMGTPPVYVNGFIVIATLSGEVCVMDAADGKLLNKYVIKDPVRYQPIVEKGWIYVTTVNSKLYGIDTGNPKLTGWNMWGGNAARTNVAAGH
jgi:Ca-activated chloride channel homolog